MVFAGTINEDELKIQPEFSQGIKWISSAEQDGFNNLAFEHSQIIKEYLRK
jgi:hypothetical protein